MIFMDLSCCCLPEASRPFFENHCSAMLTANEFFSFIHRDSH